MKLQQTLSILDPDPVPAGSQFKNKIRIRFRPDLNLKKKSDPVPAGY